MIILKKKQKLKEKYVKIGNKIMHLRKIWKYLREKWITKLKRIWQWFLKALSIFLILENKKKLNLRKIRNPSKNYY